MADVKFIITVDSKGAVTEVKQVNQAVDEMKGATTGASTGIGSMMKGLVLGAAAVMAMRAAIRGLTTFMKESVEGAIAQEDAIKQLEARLQSTGGVAGITKEQLLGMASGLQNVTTFGDETIMSAQGLLLTFTKIGKEVFPAALETVLDMSQALGQDLKSSSVQLGKALNDPILGVTALSRVGVQFTEDQKGMIKSLVDSGDTMGAQKLILQELQTEFGGASRAAAETFGGSLKQLSNIWGDVKESVGDAIIKNDEIKKGIKDFSKTLEENKDEVSLFFSGLVEAAMAAAKVVGVLAKGIKGLLDTIAGSSDYDEVVDSMTAHNKVMYDGVSAVGFFRDAKKEEILTLLESIKMQEKYGRDVKAMFQAIARGEEGEALKNLYLGIKGTQEEMAISSRNEVAPAIEYVTEIVASFLPHGKAHQAVIHDGKLAWIDMLDVMKQAPAIISNFPLTAIPAARDVADAWKTAQGEMQAAVEYTGEVNTEVTTVIKSDWAIALERIQDKWTTELGQMLSGAKSFKDGVSAVLKEMKQQFFDIIAQMITKWITGFVSKVVSSAASLGTSVTGGVADLAKDLAGAVASFNPAGLVAGAVGGLVGGLATALFGEKTKGSIDASNRLLELIEAHTLETKDFLFIDIRKELLQNMQGKMDHGIDIGDAQVALLQTIADNSTVMAKALKNIVPAATEADFYTRGPTLIMAGEKQVERVTVQNAMSPSRFPGGQAQAAGPLYLQANVYLDSQKVAEGISPAITDLMSRGIIRVDMQALNRVET